MKSEEINLTNVMTAVSGMTISVKDAAVALRDFALAYARLEETIKP